MREKVDLPISGKELSRKPLSAAKAAQMLIGEFCRQGKILYVRVKEIRIIYIRTVSKDTALMRICKLKIILQKLLLLQVLP